MITFEPLPVWSVLLCLMTTSNTCLESLMSFIVRCLLGLNVPVDGYVISQHLRHPKNAMVMADTYK